MGAPLKSLLLVTDLAFLAYWLFSALHAVGLIHLPEALLYPHAEDARVVAWNWSFLPVDIAFSLTGLWSAAAAQRADPLWRPLALVSLVLTMTAGAMAVSYWTLAREIEWSWFAANVLLVIWPIPFIRGLMRDMAPGR